MQTLPAAIPSKIAVETDSSRVDTFVDLRRWVHEQRDLLAAGRELDKDHRQSIIAFLCRMTQDRVRGNLAKALLEKLLVWRQFDVQSAGELSIDVRTGDVLSGSIEDAHKLQPGLPPLSHFRSGVNEVDTFIDLSIWVRKQRDLEVAGRLLDDEYKQCIIMFVRRMADDNIRGKIAREILDKIAGWHSQNVVPECKFHARGMLGGAVVAWLTPLFDFAVDPQAVGKIQSAIRNHGISVEDAIMALPGELEKYGSEATEAFLTCGDKVGKDWSHIKSQFNRPDLASSGANAIWEDGTINRARGKTDMTHSERLSASLDNHWDGLVAAAHTPEFWQRTLGNAFESAVYAACIAAVDQILVHRDELINASAERRTCLVREILETSGVAALGALPTSIVLAIALALVPGLETILLPIGIIGMVGLGIRILVSLVKHPSKQELKAIASLQSMLHGLRVRFTQDNRLRCSLW